MDGNFNYFGVVADMLPELVLAANADIANAAVTHVQERIIANGQVETGTMLNSVHAEVQDDGSQAVVVDCQNEEGEYYAAYPNYGTRYQVGNPFFEPGLEDTQPDMDTAMETMATAISKVGQ